ncbi:MAG TPA: cyclophane-forming radical SAM/SPASM peptide maturase GrrM/OscB [Steroidobacteraceae bacterium]|nr:cyclophane-forming radical SAM/SPASM peptide maturase GrrM/OscB [Steroidobacteraceae bacterium]
MHPSSPGVPSIGVVVLQPTPFCNINCTYCYLPQRNVRTQMRQDTVRTLFAKIFASRWRGEELTVIWHAGEPLVLPVSFYARAFAAIEALRPAELHLQHAIQTNGMLLTREWCDLFRAWRVGVGVSIDGPRRLNDEHRLSRKGGSTFDRTLAGIRLLREERVPFHVISVLTERSLEAPREMLEFYLAEGIEDVCFNVEESEGDHRSGLFAAADVQRRFRSFLAEFWKLSRQSGRIRFIREIDGMLPRIFRPEDPGLRNVQVEPFAMLNVDCQGNVSSFSPELLGLRNAAYADFIIGNIETDSLEDMRNSAAMLSMSRDIAAGVERCRRSCEYFSVCGGGAPVNKLTENGSFVSDRTAFCRLTQMVPTDLILEALERMEHDLNNDDLARAYGQLIPHAARSLRGGSGEDGDRNPRGEA